MSAIEKHLLAFNTLLKICSMISAILENFGLTDKESQVYLALLRYGEQPTTQIAKRTALNRGTTFLALKELVRLGLANKRLKNGVQMHHAARPHYLKSLLEQKRDDLDALEQSLGEIMPLLENIQERTALPPRVSMFEGREGMRSVLEDTLQTPDKKLFCILSMEGIFDSFGKEYFQSYVQRRIAAGISIWALRNTTQDTGDAWPPGKAYSREVRFLPKEMFFPCSIYLYGGKVLYFTSKREGFALLIESEEIFTFQKQLFELLWQTSIPDPRNE